MGHELARCRGQPWGNYQSPRCCESCLWSVAFRGWQIKPPVVQVAGYSVCWLFKLLAVDR